LQPQTPPISEEYDVVSLSSKSLYSDVEIPPFPAELGDCIRRFCFDVSGPRVLFCADSAIDLLLKSGVNNYLEFKGVDASLIYDGEKKGFSSVPGSRAAIFKDKSLSLIEKRTLMEFFKLVQKHMGGESEDVISEEDLESPFIDFLNKFRLNNNPLNQKIKWIILYAIALADYDQENLEVCKDLLKTKDGINRLALYHSSIGRFPNAPGAMLYPMYGQGELPQAFCRRAAVKGCIYVLRMPVTALLADKGSGLYKGVRLASGQDILSQQLLIDPQFVVPQALTLSKPDGLQGSSQNFIPRGIKKVARGICITRTSLKSDASNLAIVYPPRSLYAEQATSVRVLQLGSNSAVCPVGMFVLHLSALCDDASQGKKILNAAINTLFEQPTSGSSKLKAPEIPEDKLVDQSAVTEEEKPALVWTALYVQEITEAVWWDAFVQMVDVRPSIWPTEESVSTISSSPSPDGNLSYNNLIDTTKKMFEQMFNGEEYFPEEASPEDPDNVEDLGPE
uniref:Rab proteins geranylgeranyltransferase component n=1 Tax=Chenopodium quinoa TaxID=63459 RepID=A0A803MRQ0_CHEQI